MTHPKHHWSAGANEICEITCPILNEGDKKPMTRIFFALCLGYVVGLATLQAEAQSVVTAAQVNGTWQTKNGEFKVWALGKQMLQIEFSGTHEYKSLAGLMANTGDGHGVASIEGDTAIFKPDGAEDECKITMKFTHGKLVVTQAGTCGFGAGVSAEGTYMKVSTRKPKFESAEGD
jgi:hypothetical protein